MRYLSLAEVLLLHRLIMEQSGQQPEIRDLPRLASAVALPRQTFDGMELYPGRAEKAAVIGFALIQNHPFVDGNKRVGHAVTAAFLRLNGGRLDATVDETESTILAVASGGLDREAFTSWVRAHDVPQSDP